MKKFFTYSLIFVLLLAVFTPSSFVHAEGWADTYIGGFMRWILYFILQIMALFLGLAGKLLDEVIKISILNMSSMIEKMDDGLNNAWKTVRDVLNMAFIFILLYNSILVIISKKTKEDIWKIVSGIVITALLINFSMFFTKVIIDASNIATTGFYNSIEQAGQGATVAGGAITIERGLSGAFINAMKITEFFDEKNIPEDPTNSALAISYLMGILVFLVLTFSFLAIAIMLLIRFIVLIFLLMLSPVGFIGFGLPLLKSYQDQWWKALMGQCLFAPMYMFMTWIVLTLIGSDGFKSAIGTMGGSWGDLATGGAIGIIANYIIAIGLIIMTLTIAKSKASQGSTMIGNATGKLTAFAGGAVMGGAAYAGRQGLGRLGEKVANSQMLKEKAEGSGIGAWAARQTLKSGGKVGASSFDIRRGSVGEMVAKNTGINFGRGTEGIPFMGNAKAGEGGRVAMAEQEKKKVETKMDETLKRFTDRNTGQKDLASLANVFNVKSDAEKDYIYKKLSSKERAEFNTHLSPTTVSDLEKKLPLETRVKDIAGGKSATKWTELATLAMATGRSEQEQNFIYESLSNRDKVEFDKALRIAPPPTSPSTVTGTTIADRLKSTLSTEDQDKFDETSKKALTESVKKAQNENIDLLVAGSPAINPTTGVAYKYDDLLGPGKLPPKNASKLSVTALKDPEVIKRLSVEHLKDIQANHNEFDLIKGDILSIINPLVIGGTPYPLQTSQKKYVNSNDTIKASWGI